MKNIEIKTPTIKLDQFLKWSGVVGTGGQAKIMLQEGIVKVNGEQEKRRGRQLKKGDLVEVGEIYKFKIV
ncbi:MAG TPA: S4 domain-containing protein YaaA [Clostridia bacterium]|nr:S4 domain-containing protein YaaA [Clostridia bacterium]